MANLYEELSSRRKELQASGDLPEWLTTGGFQVLRKGYFHGESESLRDTYRTIAKTAARHLVNQQEEWEERFFNIMWNGWLALSTPVFNLGTNRGCPVSCSGNYVGDSIYSFYSSRLEAAMLTKNGFGTSSYLGDIRGRGDKISSGGKASGTHPVFQMFVDDMRKVSQGNTRRGAWAGYIEIEHPDFYEIAKFLETEPDDLNIGWIISDDFIKKCNDGDLESISRYKRVMKVKFITGKGYLFFIDKVNRANPIMYKDHGLSVKASNLCTEITLHSDEDHTFTCILSSLNLEKYDEWKDTDTVFVATVFLDCVASEFIEYAKNIPGLEKAVRFTEKSRALGLGALGYHSYLQKNSIPFESLEASLVNRSIFSRIKRDATEASRYLAGLLGEPEWCIGHGMRNTHLLAIAPNSSSSIICGGVSQGIEPIVANSFTQPTAAGEIMRMNPQLLDLLKSKGLTKEEVDVIMDIIHYDNGSVKNVNILTDHEKLVFKTAYEIDQSIIIDRASDRQPYICQAQSLNTFFSANEDEGYISSIFQKAFEDENIKSLYYTRTEAGVSPSKGVCLSCEG